MGYCPAVSSIALPRPLGRCGSGPTRAFIFASSALESVAAPWAHHRGGQFNTRANRSPRHNMRPSRQIFQSTRNHERRFCLINDEHRCPPTWRCGTGAVLGWPPDGSRLRNLRRIHQMTKTAWAPERQLINPNEDYELRYWSERFDVPTDEIVAAVKRVGPRVEDVARELNRHAYSEATLVPR
jgi:hypothetical protein